MLAKILTNEALLPIHELEGWRGYFERDQNSYLEGTGCFASRPRINVINGHSNPGSYKKGNREK